MIALVLANYSTRSRDFGVAPLLERIVPTAMINRKFSLSIFRPEILLPILLFVDIFSFLFSARARRLAYSRETRDPDDNLLGDLFLRT